MSRLERAIEAIQAAIGTAGDIPPERIGRDDDLIDDLILDPIELESLALILEEIFSFAIDPERLFASALYRSPASLAEYCIRQSDHAAWAESKRPLRQAGGRA